MTPQDKNSLHPMEKRLLDHWGRLAPFFGVSRASVLTMSLLALRDQPLNIDEMSGLLNISRSVLSPSLREAHHVGAVRPVYPPGSRKASYELLWTNHHGLDWFAWRATRRLAMLIDPSIQVLQEALDFDQKSPFFSPLVCQRMTEVLDTFRKQQIILRAVLSLNDQRRDELLNRIVAWTQQMLERAA